MKKKLLLFSLIFCILFTLCACEAEQMEAQTSSDSTESYNSTGKYTKPADRTVSPDLETFMPDLNRSVWNIEMEFLGLTDEYIKIRICDYDNLGYMINDLYYILERFENGNWVKLSKMNENAANSNLAIALPDLTKDYADIWSYNLLSLMPGVDINPGHYRITKVLSGKSFSLEFDII